MQMEAAREYFLEPAPRSSPEAAARRSTNRGGSGSGGSGLLQAALRAQTQAQDAVQVAAAAAEPAHTRAVDGAHGSQVAANGGTTCSARGNLLWRLENSSSSGARPEQEPSQPLPIRSGGGLPIPFSGVPASGRSSFDSYESDPGSPASGSLWYWGSPAAPAGAGRGRASTAALRGAGMKKRSMRGSSDSYDSWEDVSRGSGGCARGGASAVAHAAAAGASRLSLQHRRQHGQEGQGELPMEEEPQHPRRATSMHVGSAPSASLLSSPPSHGPLAWAAASPEGGRAGGGGGLHRVASDGQLLGRAEGHVARQAQAERAAERGQEQRWPAAHAFTVVSRVYKYRTVVLHWEDPRLPAMLRPVIQVGPRQQPCLRAPSLPAQLAHPRARCTAGPYT